MHYFKLIGNPESFRQLWENREALEKYLKRLKELMEEGESTGNDDKKEAPVETGAGTKNN